MQAGLRESNPTINDYGPVPNQRIIGFRILV